MKYKRIHGKYKYELTHPYCYQLDFTLDEIKGNEWCALYPRRMLIIEAGYQFDGLTCFPDIPWMIESAGIHDALCQLAELKCCTRLQADMEFKKSLIENCPKRSEEFWLDVIEYMYAAIRAYALILRKH